MMFSPVVGAIGDGVVFLISIFVEDEFAEADPSFPIVFGDGCVDGVTVCEDIFAASFWDAFDFRE